MKLLIPFLAIAAFVYALWLVVFRLPLPNPQGATGLRKRFYLAVLLFVGLFGALLVSDYLYRKGVAWTLESVWMTLDPKTEETFGQKLDAAVRDGLVTQEVSDILEVAFKELAYHREMELQGTCYDTGTLEIHPWESCELAFKQLELLRNARRSGKIEKDTMDKCQAVLARELEMLSRASKLSRSNSDAVKRLLDEYSKGELKPGEAAAEAAAFIVQMETGPAVAAEKSE
jgi:hypothetical protein